MKKYANNNSLAVRKMGDRCAKLYQKRLEDMADAESFADFEYLSGRFHQLTENRKDQWSCDLDHPYRLIMKLPAASSGVSQRNIIFSIRRKRRGIRPGDPLDNSRGSIRL